ncbi:hypothetical protein Sps_01033 [Shewanella psychrophila]|uniref:Uncharacterized protein n=1 Tax=Shewanella psychrophila TaxID=225848 RepID=A0A1S6HL43_9GAMM|nr:hypothetical protein [Shewanella psychrophila]AQS36222.1 hypothetical protein Sps_01033 [Shewanella psychrophila]
MKVNKQQSGAVYNLELDYIRSTYSSTAYNSQDITPQVPARPKGFLQRLLTKGQSFSFRRPTLTIATAAVAHNTPSQWPQIVDFIEKKQGQAGWDEQRLEHDVFSSWTQIYMILSGLGKVSCQFFLPLFIIVFLTMPLYDERSNFVEAFEALGLVLLYVFVPLGLLWGQFELVNRGYFTPWFLKAQKQFSLNRQTGMVTLYKSNGKPRFSHPFIEFDCILVSAPNQQGLINYALYLVHRYKGYSQGIPLHGLMPNNQPVAEYHALWNMIQRYMDTSQPMPDVLILEAARERDITTAKFDLAGKRGHPCHYWREMSDEEFTKTLEAIRDKQQKSPMVGPVIDIFKKSKAA